MLEKPEGYKKCNRCVMDTTSSLIEFDEEGNCNYCNQYLEKAEKTIFRDYSIRKKELDAVVEGIKKKGKKGKYDCIVGVSGGLDSSYLLVKAKDYGLRPLVVHFDNGWNSEIAVQNINNLVDILGFELYTVVMDWELFKDLQIAYFKASVIDIEVCTDQLIFSHLYKVARKFKVKTILSGANLWTETILPRDWRCTKKHDWTNLKNIHKKYGKLSIKKLPRLGLLYKQYYKFLGYETVTIFDKEDFKYNEVKEILTRDYKYSLYPYKHYESVFTRFYQGYILPKKFGVDKRIAHYACLVCCDEISREGALEELKKDPYPSEVEKQEDLEYILKKWKMSREEFDEIMERPIVPHSHYGWDQDLLINRVIKKIELVYKYKIAKLFGVKY